MANIIIQVSKYLIIILMAAYTFSCFSIFTRSYEDEENKVLIRQDVLLFMIQITAFIAMYFATQDLRMMFIYGALAVIVMAVILLYNLIYPNVSRLVVNNMCMLITAGMIMITRLSAQSKSPYGIAIRQLVFVVVGIVFGLIVPVLIRKMKFLKDLTWVYAGIGIVLLAAVLVLASTSYGAKLSLLGIQPSEAIKITFVFFMAALLRNGADFKTVVQATVVAGIHVGILVLSRDLGSAVIFFAAYLVMVYVATRNVGYLGLGLGAGALGSVVAYHLFGHVRQRVSAWKDPMAVYQNEGYQIVQSLFAIGTGGWFGMGLCQGSPEKIPVVKNDFIFSAICEELGGIFAVCLILVCMNFFLMIVNIALKIKKPFYKLIALGLGTEYAFQVFLTIGGATKFIPMTGVTLPLVSYGGSSVASTVLMLAIIQGLYILREDEDEEIERYRRKEAAQRVKRASEAQGSGDFQEF